MRRDLGLAARWLAATTAAVVGVAVFAPGRIELALRIYALFLAATVIILVLHALRRAFPPETLLRVTSHTRSAQPAPASLTTARNEVVLGSASSFDLHYRLVPRLQASAAALLATRRNVALDAGDDRAPSLLGAEAWELVRPDRPAPQDRREKGIEPRRLGRVVDALEAL